MKKTLLAATLAAALSPAFAQTSVSMYGIADVGVSFDRNGNDGTAFRVNSGYLSSSRLGFTGTEDLGAGLKGVFTLEMGFDADTGAFKSTSGGSAGFNRRSFVGVQGGFGTVTLGRDYNPVYWTLLATDNMGLGLYGNLLNTTQLGGTGQFLRSDNAIFYTSPNFRGLTLRGVVSAGSGASTGAIAGENFAEPRERGRLYSIGGDYVAGPLTVSAAYQQQSLQIGSTSSTDERKDGVIGAKYNFGAFSVGGGYAQIDPVGANNNAQVYWIGGTAKLGAGTVLAQFNQIRQDVAAGSEPRANTFALGYTYPLSRRTTAYASYGQVANSNGSAISLNASDNSIATTANKDPRGFAVGVRHAF